MSLLGCGNKCHFPDYAIFVFEVIANSHNDI